MKEWIEAHQPGRGGRTWLMRASGCSYATIDRAIAGRQIRGVGAAERLSAATGGEVSVAELIHAVAP